MRAFIKEQSQEDKAKELQQLKRSHITKLASVFARTNSVLTGRKISVSVVDEPLIESPAWSSSTQMWLNLAELHDEITAETILELQGLDFHELGHLRYTPRTGTPFIAWVQQNDLWNTFNVLEDNRIETLLVGYLPSIAKWLTAVVTNYIIKNEEALPTAFPLITGRRYLPTEIQQLAVDNYQRPQDVEAIYNIVDEYRQLIFVGSIEEVRTATERAKVLIKELDELIKQLAPTQSSSNGQGGQTVIVRISDPMGHSTRPTQGVDSSSVRPVSRAQQESDLGRSKSKDNPKPVLVVDIELSPATDEDTTDTTDGDVTEGDVTEETSKEDKSAVKNPDSTTPSPFDEEDEEWDYDEEIDLDLEPSPSNPAKGIGTDKGTTGTNQQVSQILDGIMDEALRELSKEINQIAKQMGVDVGLNGGNVTTPIKARHREVPANPELVLTSKAFGRELERLRAKFDPAWESEVDTGRLNVNRYLNNEDFDTCFDEWQEGRSDVTSIEAVILLDKSGSMAGNNADMAYQSMWAIKKALEEVEARTTVCLFDYDTTLLYSAEDKAGNSIRDAGADGGTNPHEAILYAKRVLAETDKPIRILFMITDGMWDSKEGEQAVTEMRNAGVLTCQAYLEQGTISAQHLEHYRHSFELLTQIKSAKDITILGRELVRIAIARNLVANS